LTCQGARRGARLLRRRADPCGAPGGRAGEDRTTFQELATPIKQQLSGVKGFKVGDEAERNVYMVGKTKDGRLAGLKTSVVET
jgi:hypothetical protein